jgi:hypothetical protein
MIQNKTLDIFLSYSINETHKRDGGNNAPPDLRCLGGLGFRTRHLRGCLVGGSSSWDASWEHMPPRQRELPGEIHVHQCEKVTVSGACRISWHSNQDDQKNNNIANPPI